MVVCVGFLGPEKLCHSFLFPVKTTRRGNPQKKAPTSSNVKDASHLEGFLQLCLPTLICEGMRVPMRAALQEYSCKALL